MTPVFTAENGYGTVLLCLHGIGSSSRSFEAQLQGLAEDHRVVAWDAPGYGRSPDPERKLDLFGYADAVVGLVGGLGGPVHLLGASWGGVIATQVALQAPELVRSLVLVDSSPGSGRTAEAQQAMRGRADELERLGADALAAARAARLLSPAAAPSLVSRATQIMAEAIRPPGYGYAAECMADTDLTDRLGRVSAPTLVICGERDTVTGPPSSRILANEIPDAIYVSLHGAGHLANQEAPSQFNAWVASFLQIVEGTKC